MRKGFVPLIGMGVLVVLALTLLQLLLTGPNTQLHTLPQTGWTGVSTAELLSQPGVVRATSTLPASPAPSVAANTLPATPPPTLPPSGATPEPIPTPSPQPPPVLGDVAAGKATFNRLCTFCHPGGGKGAGPSLLGVGREMLFQAARKGKGTMPAVGASLSEKELEDLLAYLQSLKGGG